MNVLEQLDQDTREALEFGGTPELDLPIAVVRALVDVANLAFSGFCFEHDEMAAAFSPLLREAE